jgi:tripartite tricarboxylate transporter TctB family protein
LSRKQADLIFSILLLALVSWMVWEAGKWDLRARLFPVAVGVPAIGLALLQLGFLLRPAIGRQHLAMPEHSAPETGPETVPPAPGPTGVIVAEAIEHAFGAGSASEAEAAIPEDVARARTLHMVGWVLAITLGIVLLGFELGAALLTFLFLHFASRERLRTSILIAVGTYLSFYILFDRLLFIPFPAGAVGDALGGVPLDHRLMDPIADFIQRR